MQTAARGAAPAGGLKFSETRAAHDGAKAASERIDRMIERRQSVRYEQRPAAPLVDYEPLSSAKFDAESFVADNMTGGGQEELDAFMSAIRSEQERTQGLLKQSAVRDYEQFIVMSREVSGLDSEMAQLRRNLDSLSALSEQLFAFDIGSSPSSSALDEPSDAGKSESRARASKRSSILDLENLYVTQMRSLWDRVEGSQKFLPAIPGRHVVYESGRWIELNSATWRRKRLVHLILLNDGVLIAVQKRSKPAAASSGGDTAKDGSSAGAKATRLVAERFFPIAQMRLSSINETNLNKPGLYSSMAPSSVLKYAINIMYSGERIVLQTNAADEKTKLLAAFSSLASDLKQQQQRTATKKEKENDYRNSICSLASQDDNDSTAGNSRPFSNADLFRSLSLEHHRQGSSEARAQDLRKMQEDLDAVDIAIAHRDIQQAVKCLQRGVEFAKKAKGDQIATELIFLRYDEHANTLAAMICKDLERWAAIKDRVCEYVGYMRALNLTARARDTLLSARSNTIRQRTRLVKFEGDIPLYVSDVSVIVFTLIKNTAQVYHEAFKEPDMASGFIVWTKSETEDFISLVQRQLGSIPQDSPTYRNAIDAIKEQCKILEKVGIDMGYALSGLFFANCDHSTASAAAAAADAAVDSDASATGSEKSVDLT